MGVAKFTCTQAQQMTVSDIWSVNYPNNRRKTNE